MSLATLSDIGTLFCVSANKPHICCPCNHVYYNYPLLVFYVSMDHFWVNTLLQISVVKPYYYYY